MANIDLLAVAWFLAAWFGFSFVLDHTRLGRRSLSAAMDRQRAAWMEAMAQREMRIVDISVISGLQQGTAFFASTALLAIGGTFTLLSSTEDVLTLFNHLPLSIEVSRAEWELKMVALMLMYVYAFFKFGWSYRLFNYASILIGAVPSAKEAKDPRTRQAIKSATQMTVLASRHFNRGLRAFFLALGILGWFIHAAVFVVTTSFVAVVLLRRQFFSASLKAAEMEDRPD